MPDRSEPHPFGPIGAAVELQLDLLDGDGAQLRWRATAASHQPAGIVHGGVHAWIHETAASIAASAWYGERGRVVGVSNLSDFYRAVREGALTSVAAPVHRGTTQQVWTVETRDDDGRLVARGQVRLQNLAAPRP